MKKANSEETMGSTSITELLENKRRLEALISSSTDAIVAIDPDKKIIKFSRQAEILLGYLEADLVGQSVMGLYEDKEKARENYRIIRDFGKIDRANIVLIHKDGRKIPISFSGKLIVDEGNNILGQVGFMRDLHEIQLLEMRLKALIETSIAVNSTSELGEILELVVRSALLTTPTADRASIHFYDEWTGNLNLKISSFDYSAKVWEAQSFRMGEGIAGWVFENQQPVICGDAPADVRYKKIDMSELKPHSSMLCIPISSKKRKIGVISLSHSTKMNSFSPDDLDMLIGFTNNVAVALENAKELTNIKKEAKELDFLRSASLKINAQTNLEDILTAILESGNKLLGTEMAVVHWKSRGEGKIQTYAVPAELANLKTDPRLEDGLTAEVFQSGQPVVVPDTSQDTRVNPLVREARIQSLVGYPLHLRGRVAGALFFNSLQLHFFNEHEIHLISLLLPLAAVAIENSNIIGRLKRTRLLSESLMQVSSKLAATQTLEEQMAALNKFMGIVLDAPMFYLGLYNENKDVVDLKINFDNGVNQKLISIPMKNNSGRTISSYVVKEQKPVLWYTEEQKITICQQLNINPLNLGIASQTCLAFPLEVEGSTLGVISIQSPEANAWDEIEASTFQTLAHQASIAIHNTHLMLEVNSSFEHLRNTYQASEKIISELEPNRALNMLVSNICNAVGAFKACAILIDENGKPYHLSTSGYKENELELATAKREEGISMAVFRSGQPEFIDDIHSQVHRVNRNLIEEKVRATSCLPIIYKDINLGVLWVHYDQPHRFIDREKEALRLFTNQAAIAYENAKLHQQVNKSRDTAIQVAQMTALGDLKSTLDAIVSGVKDVLGCDIVTLYTYWEDKDQFDLPPATAGEIHFQEKLIGNLNRGAAPYKIIVKDDIYVSEDSQNDPVLGTPFAIRENIISGIGVPLKMHRRRVGVLFINYCNKKHVFTKEELSNIRLFSAQAAVAISNAMLYEEEQKRKDVLKIIDDAGRDVTSFLQMEDIFDSLVRHAYKLTGEKGEIASFATINIIEGNQTILKAVFPPSEEENIIDTNLATTDLNVGVNGRIGIIGRAVKNWASVLVKDVEFHLDYLCASQDTKCELAVPIIYRNEVVGVINVEHKEIGGLDDDDRQNIESLAAHAAVAIQNARIYQALQRKSQHQEAIYEASKIINANFERTEKELLNLLVQQMVIEIVPAASARNNMGSILLYDYEKNELKVECNYSLEEFGANIKDEVRSLSHPQRGRIGISGRAVITKKPQRVGDVITDDDYLNNNDKTKSELDVPMLEGDTVLGVLSLQCDQLNGFDKEAEDALCAFAELAAMAIQNTRHLRKLKETQEEAVKMKAINWWGLTSATWRHSIGNKATTINEIALLAQQELKKGFPPNTIDQELELIREIVVEIERMPFPPLTSEKDVVNFPICSLVRDRLNMFREKKGRYGDTNYELYFNDMNELILVRADPELIRRILDTLLDNAIEAMKDSREKKITVTLTHEEEGVTILVTDTGTGIPKDRQKNIFEQPIFKNKDESGSGIGLFLANYLIQSYKGHLKICSTGLDGTKMAFWLPIQK